MYRLSQAARRNRDFGTPLHNPFTRLKNHGLEFYPGDTVIMAAADGTGKSVLAMLLALQSESTSLYVSPDTSASTTIVRCIQHLFKVDGATAREMYLSNDPRVQQAFNSKDNVRWNFRRMVDTGTVAGICNAYAEVKGHYPGFVTVDGLSSLSNPEESAAVSNSRNQMVQELNTLAARTKSCVLIPTHVKGGEQGKNLKNTERLDKGQVLDNVTKLAAIVLTLCRREEDGALGVAIVKNRNDEASPTANKIIWLDTDLRKMQVTG